MNQYPYLLLLAIAVTMLSKHTTLYMLKSKNEKKKQLKPKLNTHSFHVLQSYYVGPISAERSIDQCKTKEEMTHFKLSSCIELPQAFHGLLSVEH